jgi:hypothetical protein
MFEYVLFLSADLALSLDVLGQLNIPSTCISCLVMPVAARSDCTVKLDLVLYSTPFFVLWDTFVLYIYV